MIRCFVQSDQLVDATLTLTADDREHIIGSLRLKPGDTLSIVTTDTHQCYTGQVVQVHKNCVTLAITQTTSVNPPQHVLTLGLGITKFDAFRETLHHCVQLPITNIVPLVSQYMIPKKSAFIEKWPTWLKIIKQASYQSQRQYLPVLAPVQSLETYLTTVAKTPLFVCDECESDYQIRQAIQAHPKATDITVIIGPEGGFSDQERAQFPVRPVSLGTTRLKAPQAAFYATSILSYAYAFSH